MRLVLTRPQDDSERFAPILRAHGHDVLIAPLMRVETIEAALRPHWGAIVITSANAATAIASHPVHAQLVTLPVYAVGKRSADAARQAGFANVATAGGIAAELAVVYRAVTAPFPSALIAALKAGDVDGVLHFSRRSADNFIDAAAKAGVARQALGLRHFCLSAQIAAPLKAAGAADIIVAKRPDEAAFVALLEAAKA